MHVLRNEYQCALGWASIHLVCMQVIVLLTWLLLNLVGSKTKPSSPLRKASVRIYVMFCIKHQNMLDSDHSPFLS